MIRLRFRRWTDAKCWLVTQNIGTSGFATIFAKRMLLIGIESEIDEAEIRITSGATVSDAIEDYRTAFFGTGFQDFEAGDFLVEESKREIALRQLRAWIGEHLAAVCGLPQRRRNRAFARCAARQRSRCGCDSVRGRIAYPRICFSGGQTSDFMRCRNIRSLSEP